MKHPALLAACSVAACVVVVLTPPAHAAWPGARCDTERGRLEAQRVQAQAHGQAAQVAVLTDSLAAQAARCTPQALAREAQKRVQQAQVKVAARERRLAEAERLGDAAEVMRRREMLAAAQAERLQAEAAVAR